MRLNNKMKIKYRAINPESKIWYFWEPSMTKNDTEFFWHSELLENYCKFTGLLDKAGVEIYEGDIVVFRFDYKNPFDARCGTKMIDVVEFHDGSFLLINKSIGGAGSLIPRWLNRLRVIGNIYENPELLEE